MQEKKMGKIRASYLLSVESFEFLRKDPEMFWVPVMSFFANLVVLGSIFGAYLVYLSNTGTPLGSENHISSGADYLFAFIGYIATAFILTYFQGVIATMVHMRIEGKNPLLSDGIQNSNAHLQKIFYWSLLSATVGVILNVIQERFGWLGKLFSFFGDVAWAILSFFMVPVLVLEDGSITHSLKRSGKIFRDMWGETLIMNFSLSIFFGMLYLLWFVMCGVILFFLIGSSSLLGMIALIIGFLAGIIVLATVGSLLGIIFKVVLYEYSVTGKVPESFTPELIIGALKRGTVSSVVPSGSSAL
jgi:Family of unknown function (DUF6159)